GSVTVMRCGHRVLAGEGGMRRGAIGRVPDGEYRGEDWLDGDGSGDDPVRIAVTVRIRGDAAEFDFAGTAPEVRGPLNATRFVTASAVFYAVRALIGPEIPANDGCYRPLSLRAPAGRRRHPGPA